MYIISILNYRTCNTYVIYNAFVYKCIMYIASGNGHLNPVAIAANSIDKIQFIVTICGGDLSGYWAPDFLRPPG